MTAPVLSWTDEFDSPISSLLFRVDGQTGVVPGGISDQIPVKLYNDQARAGNAGPAFDVHLTTYDAAGGQGTKTAPVRGGWVQVAHYASAAWDGYQYVVTYANGWNCLAAGGFQALGGTTRRIPVYMAAGVTQQPGDATRSGETLQSPGYCYFVFRAVVPSDATPNNFTPVLAVEYSYVP